MSSEGPKSWTPVVIEGGKGLSTERGDENEHERSLKRARQILEEYTNFIEMQSLDEAEVRETEAYREWREGADGVEPIVYGLVDGTEKLKSYMCAQHKNFALLVYIADCLQDALEPRGR